MVQNVKRLLNLLLVEDDDAHARIIERNIMKERIANSFVRVKDGVEALEYLRKQGEYVNSKTPDIVLLDLKLPKMDGHEVLAEIRKDEVLKSIPVVILTTSDEQSDVQKAYQHNVNSYLVKPVNMLDFRKMIRESGLYWGTWNLPPQGLYPD